MNPISSINFTTIIASGCYFLLAFIVFVNPRKVNVKGNKWMALFLVCIALVLLDDPLVLSKFYHSFPVLIGMLNIPAFSIAPLLFFSVTYYIDPFYTFRAKDLWHFTLLGMICLLMVLALFLPADEKIRDLEAPTSNGELTFAIIVIILPLAVYWILSYRKLWQHQKNVGMITSNVDAVSLIWLRNFLWCLAAMVLAWFFELALNMDWINQCSNVIYLSSAFYLAYYVLHQGEVYSSKPNETLELRSIILEQEEHHTVKKQLLTDDQLVSLKAALNDLMIHQKPFLDNNLSLAKLAHMLQISSHELSYLINTGYQDNFFGLVSKYRVEESKRLLVSPDHRHLSMVGIAFEAGFNSKTTFNTAFKRAVGMSPSEFQRLEMTRQAT